jgi:hypothetical protein
MTRKVEYKISVIAGCWWLTPVILATQEAEISRIMVRSQPSQLFPRPYFEKKKKNHRKGLVE